MAYHQPPGQAENAKKERCIRSLIELEGFVKTTGDNLVLVYYSSPKCGLCRTTDTFIAKMCTEHPELVLCKVNTEEAKEFIDAYGITGLPAFQYYRSGRKLYEFAGASTEHIYKIVCELNGY